MSSFIGHSLAAFTIGKSLQTDNKSYLFWKTWLIFSALVPDIDYIVPLLNAPNNRGVRITHSIVFCLIAPFLGIVYLCIFNRKNIIRRGLQACLAGLSHLLLDNLVGSRQGDPLLYPFSQETFQLPFGILPSAAKISITNYYLYRNLLIECGILIPACCLILYFTGKLKLSKTLIVGLSTAFIIFLIWSITLSR